MSCLDLPNLWRHPLPDPIKRYLITGASGQLGHELVRQLGESAIPKTSESLDLCDKKEVDSTIAMLRPDAVINAANTPAFAAGHLFQACAENGVPFIHVGCSKVFDQYRGAGQRWHEDVQVASSSDKGQVEIQIEHSFLKICQEPKYWKGGFKCWLVRTSTLFERPWRAGSNLLQTILSDYEARRATAPLSKLSTTSPTYTPHLARALLWMADNRRDVSVGIYHIANEGIMSLHEIGQELSIRSKVPFAVSEKLLAVSIKSWALNCDKYKRLGGPSMPTCQQAIGAFMTDLNANSGD